jgi:hypothetical protein
MATKRELYELIGNSTFAEDAEVEVIDGELVLALPNVVSSPSTPAPAPAEVELPPEPEEEPLDG